jgi:DNA invertase Pin-like site-specific DNA recombinase
MMAASTEGKVGDGRAAAIYARAPGPAEHNRTPVAEQLAAGRALAERLGYAVTEETTLSDSGPGTTMARPGLAALFGLLANRRAEALIVYTLDRLAQSEGELLDALQKELRRREIPLYIANLPRGYRYDPTTGDLAHDPAEVAAANREDWRPPEYIVIPRG